MSPFYECVDKDAQQEGSLPQLWAVRRGGAGLEASVTQVQTLPGDLVDSCAGS